MGPICQRNNPESHSDNRFLSKRSHFKSSLGELTKHFFRRPFSRISKQANKFLCVFLELGQ